jgi:chromosome segregation ATPase
MTTPPRPEHLMPYLPVPLKAYIAELEGQVNDMAERLADARMLFADLNAENEEACETYLEVLAIQRTRIEGLETCLTNALNARNVAEARIEELEAMDRTRLEWRDAGDYIEHLEARVVELEKELQRMAEDQGVFG